MFQKGDNNYKIFIFSAASLFASSNVLAYTNVVPMFLCPNIFCMVVICVPRKSVPKAMECGVTGDSCRPKPLSQSLISVCGVNQTLENKVIRLASFPT